MKSNIIPTQLLSVKEAAKQLGVSEKTLWSISAPRGPLPTVHIGSRVLYDPADLQRFIESRKTKGGVA
jgi:excisionase family DNA binding protein